MTHAGKPWVWIRCPSSPLQCVVGWVRIPVQTQGGTVGMVLCSRNLVDARMLCCSHTLIGLSWWSRTISGEINEELVTARIVVHFGQRCLSQYFGGMAWGSTGHVDREWSANRSTMDLSPTRLSRGLLGLRRNKIVTLVIIVETYCNLIRHLTNEILGPFHSLLCFPPLSSRVRSSNSKDKATFF